MKPLRTLSLLLMTAATLAFAGCSKEDPQGQPSWGGGGGGTDTPKQPGPCSNMIVAHRGGSTEAGTTAAPDNSISSLQYAMTLGCYASECDIYWTADNDVIVAHADSQCKINGRRVHRRSHGTGKLHETVARHKEHNLTVIAASISDRGMPPGL